MSKQDAPNEFYGLGSVIRPVLCGQLEGGREVIVSLSMVPCAECQKKDQQIEAAREAITTAQYWADMWKGHAFKEQRKCGELRAELEKKDQQIAFYREVIRAQEQKEKGEK